MTYPELNIAVTDSILTTEEVDFREWDEGTIHVPDGSSITTLTFHTAPAPGGEYEAAYTDQNAAVAMTVAANRSYPIPTSFNAILTALAGCGAFKMVGNAAGTVVLVLKRNGG